MARVRVTSRLPVLRGNAAVSHRRIGGVALPADQAGFLLTRPSFRQNLAPPEKRRHRVAADGVGLPRRHDGLNLLRGKALCAEIGVQLDEDLFIRHVVRRFLRRVPPVRPAENLRQRRAHVHRDVAEDAVLTTLPEFDGLSGFADFLLAYKETGAEGGEKSFIAVHRALESLELARELKESSISALAALRAVVPIL